MGSIGRWGACSLALALGQTLVAGCAANGDAASRELLAITHLAAEPVGLLSVSDDGTFSFLNWTSSSQTRGALSSAEFATLRAHLTPAKLEALYAQGSDSGPCDQETNSYFLHTKAGVACFVVATVSDPAARATLDFFVELFAQKAK